MRTHDLTKIDEVVGGGENRRNEKRERERERESANQ